MIIKYDALYSPDDANVIVGLKVPDGVEPNNALVSGGDLNIGWTSNGVLPRVNTANMLSYSRTEYDVGGRVWKVYTLDKDKVEHVTTYGYDKAGKQISVTDDLNNSTQTYYIGTMREHVTDARNNTTYFDYDALGRLTRTKYPAAGANPLSYVHVQYDTLGRKVFETEQTTEDSGQITDATKIKRFEYDSAGRLTAAVLAKVEFPKDSGAYVYPRYEYKYDIYGNMLEMWDNIRQADDGSKDYSAKRVTKFTYDELDNQTSRILPDNSVEYKLYDSLSRLFKATDFKGQITKFMYDVLGRLQYKKYYVNQAAYDANTVTTAVEYVYDGLSRIDQVKVNDSVVQDFAYDIEGRIVSVTTPQGYIGYDYDPITGRRTSVYTPADKSVDIVNYTYDELGRLKEVTAAKLGGDGSWPRTTHYGYNAVGSIDYIEHGNGNYVKYSYDELNRLTKVTNWSDSSQTTKLSEFEYALTINGMRNGVTETDGSGQVTTIGWTYDNLNRLLGETYNAPGTSNDYTHNYTYNLVSNRLTKAVAGAGTTYYQYNSRDELLKESPNADYSNPMFTYQYDENGSMTSQTDNWGLVIAYGYNLQNKLETMTLDGEELASYEYNPDGIRVKAIQEGVTTNYLIDAYNHTGYSQVFKETRNTSPVSQTTYIIGSTVLAQSNGTTLDLRSLLRDGHGSVRQLSDYSGLISGQVFNYDAYGNIVNYVSPETNLLYTGEMFDWYIGGYNLRGRDSRPDLGIFMTEDTFPGNPEDPLSLNKYLYAHGNPVNNIDPTGEMTVPEVMANMTARIVIFTVQHPRLVASIGIAIDIIMPQSFQEAMIGSGIPPFQFAGELGLAGKGASRSIFALKNPTFKRIIDGWNKSASGRMSRQVGLEFQNYFKKLMPGAKYDVELHGTNYEVDFDWQGYFIEIKSGISGFNKEQLKAAAKEAKRLGRTLVYYFLEKPSAPTEKAILEEGGNVVYFYERKK